MTRARNVSDLGVLTPATSSSTASTLVARDQNENFSANKISLEDRVYVSKTSSAGSDWGLEILNLSKTGPAAAWLYGPDDNDWGVLGIQSNVTAVGEKFSHIVYWHNNGNDFSAGKTMDNSISPANTGSFDIRHLGGPTYMMRLYPDQNSASNPCTMFVSGHIQAEGDITADGDIAAAGGSSSNWNTAFGWGDHSTQNYAVTTTNLSQFAATTSAQLAGVISDETGSGSLVFGTSPTITTPTLSGDTTVSGNVAGALTLSVENTNVTGSSILQLNSGAGTKYVNFLATDNGDYVQEANANLPTRYADYDTHIWRNTAGTEKMRLDTSTGDFTVGNFVFDSDQTVGAGQDNYVMTYDNTSGKVSLEAASGGGVTTGKAIAMAMIFGG